MTHGRQGQLITDAQAGDPYATPPLATSAYFDFNRGMGTAVRISRGNPQGALSRWTDRDHWPTVYCLMPSREIFNQGLPPEEFRDRYIAGLDATGAERIAAALNAIPCDDTGQLVLLCFCRHRLVLANPWACHRRIFAAWFGGVTGRSIPELAP